MDISYYKRLNGEFSRRIGLMTYYVDLEKLGLSPRSAIGTFWPRDIPILLEFCRKNPNYHIVTDVKSGGRVNKYVEGNHMYKLAKGDTDPDLQLQFPQEVKNHISAELYLLGRRLKF